MTLRWMVLLCAAGLLTSCGGGSSGDAAPAGGSASASSTRFVAFGDAGTGSERQIAVGNAMAEVCEARGCDFAVELGDNFYVSGVTSVDDAQFQQKFEIPYDKLKVPVFVTLGNHDNSRGPGEGSDNARGEHQVDYHYLGKSPSHITLTFPTGCTATPVTTTGYPRSFPARRAANPGRIFSMPPSARKAWIFFCRATITIWNG